MGRDIAKLLSTRQSVHSLFKEVTSSICKAEEEEPQRKLEPPLSQNTDYERFVCTSNAYHWLLHEVRLSYQLEYSGIDRISTIGAIIRHQLRKHEPLLSLSRRSPLPSVTMVFKLDWNPVRFLHEHGLDPKLPNVLSNVLCLTGTVSEAQATTVVEYMAQTWPETGKPLLSLVENLLSLPEGKECVSGHCPSKERNATRQGRPANVRDREGSNTQLQAKIDGPSSCYIRVTGRLFFVVEIAEQLGWLAAQLRAPATSSRGVTMCYPNVRDVQVDNTHDEGQVGLVGTCHIIFDYIHVSDQASRSRGRCWSPLFPTPVLVAGYPILARPVSDTGLEISLQTMALLIRTRHVVLWNERVLMKGFGSIAVATLATAGVVMWHLLLASGPQERVSYADSRLDKVNTSMPDGFSLRNLENSRHIIGWCAQATEVCGECNSRGKELSAYAVQGALQRNLTSSHPGCHRSQHSS